MCADLEKSVSWTSGGWEDSPGAVCSVYCCSMDTTLAPVTPPMLGQRPSTLPPADSQETPGNGGRDFNPRRSIALAELHGTVDVSVGTQAVKRHRRHGAVCECTCRFSATHRTCSSLCRLERRLVNFNSVNQNWRMVYTAVACNWFCAPPLSFRSFV